MADLNPDILNSCSRADLRADFLVLSYISGAEMKIGAGKPLLGLLARGKVFFYV